MSDEEIANVKQKDFYVPVLSVETETKFSVDLEWNDREIPGVTDEEKRIPGRTDAERIVQNA